jgi:hypothetical protein
MELQIRQRTDEEILRAAPDELPELRKMSSHLRMQFFGALEERFPTEVEAWQFRKNQEAELEAALRRNNRRTNLVARAAAWLVLAGLVIGLAFGLIRLVQYFFAS